jgi:predicted alpha/beta-fold hydrolase
MVLALGKTAASLLLAADLTQRVRRPVSTPAWTVGSGAARYASVLREMYGDASFRPTPWLSGLLGGHLQTIWYGLDQPPEFGFSEERWQTADGGTLGLAWADAPSLPEHAPIVLILPGLCGSVDGTGYSVRAMLDAGMRPAVFHSRGCGVGLTSPNFNLFGDTDDLRAAIARIAEQRPGAPVCLYSISAGTALMVRYLGEEGEGAPITAAVANCPGYDIGVCMQRVAWLYNGGYYMGVLKRHWLTGENGDVLRAASPELFAKMEAAPDMHSSWLKALSY